MVDFLKTILLPTPLEGEESLPVTQRDKHHPQKQKIRGKLGVVYTEDPLPWAGE